MKVYCPPQPTRLVNNGTFTKNPEPTVPTFVPLPTPPCAKTAAKVHPNNPPFYSLKPSNCLLTGFTPLKPSNSTLTGKSRPNAVGGNCTCARFAIIVLQSSCVTLVFRVNSLKCFNSRTHALSLFAVRLKAAFNPELIKLIRGFGAINWFVRKISFWY